MHKDKLKGKWMSYMFNGQREGKVIRINGNTLTVKNAIGERKRIHPKKLRIIGVYFRHKLEDIEWN